MADAVDMRLREPSPPGELDFGHALAGQEFIKRHASHMPYWHIGGQWLYANTVVDNLKTLNNNKFIDANQASAMLKHSKGSRPTHFLREWRTHRGLTQDAAADRIGVSQEYLGRIENGRRRYNQEFLEAAADAYQTDPGSLLMRNPLLKDAPWSIENRLVGVSNEKRAIIEAALEAMLKAG